MAGHYEPGPFDPRTTSMRKGCDGEEEVEEEKNNENSG